MSTFRHSTRVGQPCGAFRHQRGGEGRHPLTSTTPPARPGGRSYEVLGAPGGAARERDRTAPRSGRRRRSRRGAGCGWGPEPAAATPGFGRGLRHLPTRWRTGLLTQPARGWPKTSTQAARGPITSGGPACFWLERGYGKTRVSTAWPTYRERPGAPPRRGHTFVKRAGDNGGAGGGSLAPFPGDVGSRRSTPPAPACCVLMPSAGYRTNLPSTTKTTPPAHQALPGGVCVSTPNVSPQGARTHLRRKRVVDWMTSGSGSADNRA